MQSVVGFVIRNSKREFLLVKRDAKPDIPYQGAWVFPGGGIEAGETPVRAAVREMLEEFGMRVRTEDLALVGEYTRGDGVRCIIFIYRGTEAPGPLQEGEEARWFSWREVCVQSLGFEQQRYLLPIIARSCGCSTEG